MNSTQLMYKAANNIRILAASMVEKANSGHPGGAMGGADFINVLFSEFLVYDPENPEWTGRDRFYLDPGHMSAMLYSALALQGKFTLDELKEFRQWGSPTPGHPERDLARGIENSSGPLGQGHAFAAGNHQHFSITSLMTVSSPLREISCNIFRFQSITYFRLCLKNRSIDSNICGNYFSCIFSSREKYGSCFFTLESDCGIRPKCSSQHFAAFRINA